ncbi:hypothetical protein Tco_1519493 [Tanacetum coccineum]
MINFLPLMLLLQSIRLRERRERKRSSLLLAEKDEEILCLKGTPLEFTSFFRGQFQGLVQKFLASDEFSIVQGELLSLAASVGFKHGLSMHQTKDEFAAMLKKMANFMPGVQDRLAEASFLVAQTDYAFINKISKHAIDPLLVILHLEPEKLSCSTNVPTLRDAHVSHPIVKESTVTPASKSLDLSTNVAPASFVGTSHVLDHAAEVTVELTVYGQRLVSSGITDVFWALAVVRKGDGSFALVPFL